MSEVAPVFRITVTAEVRDKDGNLKESVPVVFDDVTADQARALGAPLPEEDDQ